MALRELLAKFDIRVDGANKLRQVNSQFGTAKKGAESLLTTATALKGAFAALAAGGIALAVKGLISWVTEVTEAVDSIGKLSTATGVSTDAIQAWTIVAQEAGGSQQDIATGFRTLARAANEAADGTKTYKDTFDALGVSVTDESGNIRGLEDLFLEVTSAIGGTESETKRLALAQEVLGRGAIKLLPGLKGTREEMQASLERARELAGVFSEDMIRASEATNDEVGRLKNLWMVFRSQIVMLILPTFRQLVDWLSQGFRALNRLNKETGFLGRLGKLLTFGSAVKALSFLVKNFAMLRRVASAVFRVIMRFAPAIARFFAWALILDDIMVFLQGGDSALGRLLDSLFGKGTAKSVLDFINETAKDLKSTLTNDLIPAVSDLWDTLKETGAAEEFKKHMKSSLKASSELLKIFLGDIAAVAISAKLVFGHNSPAEVRKLEKQLLASTATMRGYTDRFWSSIGSGSRDAWKAVTSSFTSAGDRIKGMFTSVTMAIGGFFVGMFEDIRDTAQSTWDHFGFELDGLESNAASTNALLVSVFGETTASIGTFFSGMFAGISDGATAAWDWLAEGAQGVADSIVDAFSGAWDWLVESVSGVAAAVRDQLSAMVPDKVLEFFGSTGAPNRAPGATPAPTTTSVGGNRTSTTVTDNRKVEVKLEGKQTPETVRAATQRATQAGKELFGARQNANALIRGGL